MPPARRTARPNAPRRRYHRGSTHQPLDRTRRSRRWPRQAAAASGRQQDQACVAAAIGDALRRERAEVLDVVGHHRARSRQATSSTWRWGLRKVVPLHNRLDPSRARAAAWRSARRAARRAAPSPLQRSPTGLRGGVAALPRLLVIGDLRVDLILEGAVVVNRRLHQREVGSTAARRLASDRFRCP